VPEPRTRSRIWIVDDSPTEALIAQRSLGADYDFETFHDGATVVERLASSDDRPDALLLDWVMPNMTGDEVCRYLRSNPRTKSLPIILVTASRIETADIVAGFKSGANDYVSRPFAPQELRARVDAVLRTSNLREIAQRERQRLATVNQLGRALLETDSNVEGILDQLATSLTMSLCDGCAILLLPGVYPQVAVARHNVDESATALAAISSLADPAVHSFKTSEQARQMLPPAYWPYIERFGLHGLGILPFPISDPIQGVVTVTRDRGSLPFHPDDIATITTCIEYASFAIQTALRFDAERAIAAEREATSQYLQQMLAIVGHDLRTPLGAMNVGIGLLGDIGAADPQVAPIVRRLESTTRRMTGIVEQLLDVTRARLGHGMPMKPVEVNLVALARSAIEELSLTFAKTKFELVAAGDVLGMWDGDRLAQMLANLMSNAVQYGRLEAPVVLAISTTAETVTIAITNANREGPIPPDEIATLFDPYQRGRDESRTSRGLGLGLYIVYQIVQAHGGTITVESNEQSTTFSVTLPLSSKR
jgi:signal transduction histidine kinase